MVKDLYNPHLRTPKTTAGIMKDVCIALLPAAIGSVYFFGIDALVIILVSVATCVTAEFFWQEAHGQVPAIGDFSAVVTGMLLAFNMPSTTPIWAVILAAVFAIIVVKQLFGGIGSNVFNPALMGRLFLMTVYPVSIMNYAPPKGVDAVSGATILSMLKSGASEYGLWDAFIGRVPGALGETSALLLLIGFAWLIYKKEVNLSVSLAFFATVMVLTLLFGQNPILHFCSGGLVLGGCFMLTDYNFSSKQGHILYGIAAGIIVAAIRLWGIYPEGVCYAILLTNCMAPLIDKIKPKHIYGVE